MAVTKFKKFSVGVLTAAAIAGSGGVAVTAASVVSAGDAGAASCRTTGVFRQAGTKWVFTRCGNRMTVVRTGKKGYCKQSYPVNGRRWYPGAACGAPGA